MGIYGDELHDCSCSKASDGDSVVGSSPTLTDDSQPHEVITLHPKASLKLKTGEVVVGSSPTLTDEFIDTAVEESRKYAISKGAEYKGMAVIPDIFKVTCGIILLSGYNRLPSEKMYSPDSLDRVQEGLVRTLHPKASLKPKNGEVVVGSSPTLDNLDTFRALDNLFTSMGLLKWLSSRDWWHWYCQV